MSYRYEACREVASYAHTAAIIAFRIGRQYRNVPSAKQLQSDFGMSRATAYRWRRAFIAAGIQGTEGARA